MITIIYQCSWYCQIYLVSATDSYWFVLLNLHSKNSIYEKFHHRSIEYLYLRHKFKIETQLNGIKMNKIIAIWLILTITLNDTMSCVSVNDYSENLCWYSDGNQITVTTFRFIYSIDQVFYLEQHFKSQDLIQSWYYEKFQHYLTLWQKRARFTFEFCYVTLGHDRSR